MTALSIVLPDNLARASQEAAHQLGFSRSEFIRQAITHEIENVKKRIELRTMLQSVKAMKNSPEYLQEIEELENLNTSLPDDEDEWWNKK